MTAIILIQARGERLVSVYVGRVVAQNRWIARTRIMFMREGLGLWAASRAATSIRNPEVRSSMYLPPDHPLPTPLTNTIHVPLLDEREGDAARIELPQLNIELAEYAMGFVGWLV